MIETQGNPRIVIYGTGQIGLHIARFAVEKGWPIVAAFNRAGAKVGQDLGRLAGLDRELGVVVQDCDTASYAGLAADVALVCTDNRLRQNFVAHERLIRAGLNVLCHGAESYYPFAVDPELAAQIDQMAKEANVTFTGGGIWDLSRIWAGIMVTSPCTEIRALHHISVTDAQRTGVKLLPIVGVGLGIEEFNEKLVKAAGGVGGIYGTIPRHVLESIGYTVTSVTERREPVLFDQPIHCRLLDRDIPAGVCAGSRVVVEAETEEGVIFDARIEVRLLKDGEAEHMLWAVDGKPSSRIRVERDDSTHATASSLFNRIPDVIAARPGIVPISQLGPMRHSALKIGRRAAPGGS